MSSQSKVPASQTEEKADPLAASDMPLVAPPSLAEVMYTESDGPLVSLAPLLDSIEPAELPPGKHYLPSDPPDWDFDQKDADGDLPPLVFKTQVFDPIEDIYQLKAVLMKVEEEDKKGHQYDQALFPHDGMKIAKNDVNDHHGYLSATHQNLRLLCQRKLHARVPDYKIGIPRVYENHVLVANDHGEGPHFITCFDWESMFGPVNNNPVRCILPMPAPVFDIAWIARHICVCASDGKLLYLTVSDDRSVMQPIAQLNNVFSKQVRELSINDKKDRLVIGGNDQIIHNVDMTTNKVLSTYQTTAAIGSLTYDGVYEGCITGTLDNGHCLIFDARLAMKKPMIIMETGKPDCWTHACYGTANILLGYGDGEIRSYDTRRADLCQMKTTDPYTQPIGHMEYCYESGAFVTSGMNDFAVWRQLTDWGCIWSHSKAYKEPVQLVSSKYTAAIFVKPDTILTTDSDGMVGLYVQDFPPQLFPEF